MAGVRDLWAWLARPRTRNVLGFLGAGLAAVVAALWQLYLHFAPPATSAQATAAQATAAPVPAQAVSLTTPGGVDPASLKRLEAGQQRALDAETAAVNGITDQIDAPGKPAKPASAPGR
ncbi:MAG TPA: hypothetical protein VKQ54_00675 [Caulobacteraceae bacterium]|nr:hypothetical protein [Caulobacteraceae bacterium]